jgi:hypothetical protein
MTVNGIEGDCCIYYLLIVVHSSDVHNKMMSLNKKSISLDGIELAEG